MFRAEILCLGIVRGSFLNDLGLGLGFRVSEPEIELLWDCIPCTPAFAVRSREVVINTKQNTTRPLTLSPYTLNPYTLIPYTLIPKP